MWKLLPFAYIRATRLPAECAKLSYQSSTAIRNLATVQSDSCLQIDNIISLRNAVTEYLLSEIGKTGDRRWLQDCLHRLRAIKYSTTESDIFRNSKELLEVCEELRYPIPENLTFAMKQRDRWIASTIENLEKDDHTFRAQLISTVCSPGFISIYHPSPLRIKGKYVDWRSVEPFTVEGLEDRDIRLLLKILYHCTTRNGATSNIHQIYLGNCSVNELDLDIQYGGLRKRIILERWASHALTNTASSEENVTNSDWDLETLEDPQHADSNTLTFALLRQEIESYAKSQDLESQILHYGRAAKWFFEITGVPAISSSYRQRCFISEINIGDRKFSIGRKLAERLDEIGRMIGRIVESFSENATRTFLDSENLPPEERLKKSLNSGIQYAEDKPTANPQAYSFSIDFMFSASSLKKDETPRPILSDINLVPRGIGVYSFSSLDSDCIIRSQESVARSIVSCTGNGPMLMLGDPDALVKNQRYRMDILALKQQLDRLCSSVKVAPLYPSFQGSNIENFSAVIWMIRDSFFATLSPEAVYGIDHRFFNSFFFMYALEDRVLLRRLLEKIRVQLETEGAFLRPVFPVRIGDFINRVRERAKSYPSPIQKWASIVSCIVDLGLSNHVYVKSSKGRFLKSPAFVNLDSKYGAELLLEYLSEIRDNGDSWAMLEDFHPGFDDLWFGDAPNGKVTCELRTFFANL